MQDKEEIREEIETFREKLNDKIVNGKKSMSNPEILELSQEMDELLNRFNETTVK